MSRKKPADKLPDPFECACRVSGITVLLQPSDVTAVCGSMSHDQVERFFNDHGKMIASVMLDAGVSAVISLSLIYPKGDPS